MTPTRTKNHTITVNATQLIDATLLRPCLIMNLQGVYSSEHYSNLLSSTAQSSTLPLLVHSLVPFFLFYLHRNFYYFFFFFLIIRPPPKSPLFPYTTLSR